MPHLPAQQVSFFSPFHRLTNNISEELIRLYRDTKTESTIMEQWNVPSHLLQSIDWYGLRKTFIKQPPFSTSLSKAFHTQWDRQSCKRSWNQSNTDLCPLCHVEAETPQHVLRCSHETIS